MDLVEIMFQIPELLSAMATVLAGFLFEPLNIGGLSVTPLMLLGGAGLIVAIVVSIIRG